MLKVSGLRSAGKSVYRESMDKTSDCFTNGPQFQRRPEAGHLLTDVRLWAVQATCIQCLFVMIRFMIGTLMKWQLKWVN